jgi:hypothetical protein
LVDICGLFLSGYWMPAELARLFLYITHSHRRAFMQRSFRLAVQQSDGENGFLKVDLP